MLNQALLFQLRAQVRGWLRNNPGVKVGVIAGFMGVIGLVSWVIYWGSTGYYSLVWEYGALGQAMIAYMMSVAMAVMLMLGILLAATSTWTALYKNEGLKQLLTLPINIRGWWLSQFIRLLLVSAVSVMVLILPMMLAYAQLKGWGAINWFWGGLALTILVVFSQTLGSMLTIILTYNFGHNTGKWMMIGTVGWLIILGVIIKIAIPKEGQVLQSLPLTATQMIMMATYLTIVLMVIMYWIMKKYFLSSWFKFQEKTPINSGKQNHFPVAWGMESALIVNDFLWLLRNATEKGYYLFMGGLGICLILILNMVPWEGEMELVWKNAIYMAALAGFGYLVTVVSTRLIYPLMAREKKSTWFLFAAPFPRQELVSTKLTIALALLAPWMILGLILANHLALATPLVWLLSLLTMFLTVAIGVTNVTLGIIVPNFSDGGEPEMASTSTSGLVALALSLLLIGLITKFWQSALHDKLEGIVAGIGVVVVGLGLLIWWATIRIMKYENS